MRPVALLPSAVTSRPAPSVIIEHIAYNSCRNRHCPKCQGAAAQDWMLARMEDLLPVEYFHVVFTLPAQIADIAYQNKAAVYGLLFKDCGPDAADYRRRSENTSEHGLV